MPNFHIPKTPWKSDSVKARGNKTVQAPKSIILSDVNDKSPHRVVDTSAGQVVFEQGMAQLPDDARGRDIVDEYRDRIALDPRNGLAVATGRPTRWRDPVHNYFFGSMPEMPWKRDNEAEGQTAI